jgi:hypothetical protein
MVNLSPAPDEGLGKRVVWQSVSFMLHGNVMRVLGKRVSGDSPAGVSGSGRVE